jgi:hypothetical protein
MFEKRVLKGIFGPKRDEVSEGCRKLHEELNNVLFSKYNLNDKVKEDEIGRGCNTNGAKRNAYKILVGKPEGKRPLGRPRCRWVDNIKMDLREIGCGCMDWIALVQDRNQ